MIDAAIIDALLQAGASAEMIAAVVKAALASQEAKDEDRRARARSGNAERQRRHRERNASNAVTERDEPLSEVTSRDENVTKIEGSRAPMRARVLYGEEVNISKLPLTVTTLPIPKIEKQAKPAKPSPKTELVEALGDDLASEVVDHRQRMRKPLTPQAASRLAKQFLDTGRPQDAARMMIDRGWQGFNADWFANAAPRAGPGVPVLPFPQSRQGSPNGQDSSASAAARRQHEAIKSGRDPFAELIERRMSAGTSVIPG